MKIRVILMSQSPARRRLLKKIVPRFRCLRPVGVDERQAQRDFVRARPLRQTSDAVALAKHLARIKAQSRMSLRNDEVIIAADQLLYLPSSRRVLGKPGGLAPALRQLKAMQSEPAVLITAVVVRQAARTWTAVQRVRLRVRPDLGISDLRHYLLRDQPWDCAGSFKMESGAPEILAWIRSDDPTGIEGLPLMRTRALLKLASLSVARLRR
ncbi:MAG TPA: Maf family protein [Pseudobdellovibrionaceae bacterium]|nr:Maf family protein [Pseudobdellovibrionaceae bacterium]